MFAGATAASATIATGATAVAGATFAAAATTAAGGATVAGAATAVGVPLVAGTSAAGGVSVAGVAPVAGATTVAGATLAAGMTTAGGGAAAAAAAGGISDFGAALAAIPVLANTTAASVTAAVAPGAMGFMPEGGSSTATRLYGTDAADTASHRPMSLAVGAGVAAVLLGAAALWYGGGVARTRARGDRIGLISADPPAEGLSDAEEGLVAAAE